MSTTPPEQPPSGGYDRPGGAGPNVNFNLSALPVTPGNAELVVYILATILIAIIALAWLFLRMASEGELRQQLIERGLDPRAVRRAVRYGRAEELGRTR